MFDITSMLLGAAVAGIGLCLTMLSMWSTDRAAYYKVGWSVGVGFMILHVFAYWFYARQGYLVAGMLACALQPIGAAYLYASVRQYFDESVKPPRLVLRVAIPYLLIAPPIFALGYDGAALCCRTRSPPPCWRSARAWSRPSSQGSPSHSGSGSMPPPSSSWRTALARSSPPSRRAT